MLLVLPVELDLLRDMRQIDRDVFNYLAERVDYKSGVIGIERRVSYGGMALDLSERDVARRVSNTIVKCTSNQVRNSVRRLVDEGLLIGLSKSGSERQLILKRVFFADLLAAHSSVKNPVAAQLPQQLLKMLSALSIDINYLQDRNECQLPEIIDSVARTSLQHTSTGGNEKFLMSLDWKPNKTEMENILQMTGFVIDAIKPAWVSEFITYWYSEGERKMTQRQWTVKLARLVEGYLLNPGLFEQRNGVSKSVASPGFKNLELPEWARLPRDDQQLVSWMRHYGYGDPPVGLDYKQARAYLQRQIDIILGEWKRGLS